MKTVSAIAPPASADPVRGRPARRPAQRLAFAAGVLALAAVYFGAAKLGLALAFQAEQVTAVWPPTGIALAAVLVFGYRIWPGIALGALLANATANEPLGTACGIAVGNTLEAVAGAWLLHRLAGFRNALERLRDALGLVILAAAGSTTLSASVGVTSLCLGGVQPWAAYGSLWWLWWLGDASGAVLVTPLLLTQAARRETRASPRRPAEAAALIGTLVGVSLVVFAGRLTPGISRHPLEYTIFPFIVWAALRFGQPGTTAVTFVASGIAIWGTVHGFGPFATGSTHENLILLQAFMAIAAVTALLLSAAITERRRTEEALRQSEETARRQLLELEALYQTAPVGLSLVDTSLRYVRINEVLAEINGVPVQETLGRTLHEVIPEIAPVITPVYRRVFETGNPVLGFEVHGRTPREPGVERDWLVSYHPLLGTNGSVTGVNCIVHEVTERKRAERRRSARLAVTEILAQAAAANEAAPRLLQAVCENLDWDAGVLWTADAEAQVLRCLEVWHTPSLPIAAFEAATRQTAFAPGLGLPGRVWAGGKPAWILDVTNDANFPRAAAAARDGLHGAFGFPISLGREILGVIEFFSRKAQAPDPDLLEMMATVGGHIGQFLDRKQAERALQEADRRKDEFLATLAHELRNPLAPISNALQLLRLAGDDQGIQAQTRGVMERQLGQMVRLIDDLLDVSRITRNKLRLRKERMELAAAIQSALEATRPLLDELAHELTVTLPPEPVHLDADPVRLAQVFTNLLNNAAKFTPKGGHIRLSAESQGREILVSVRDNGIGIAAEHLPRLFEMFSQVTPALERSRGGLGIGLSLVRGLVELHGGRVEARSGGLELGSEFLVRLPVSAVAVQGPQEQDGAGQPCRSGPASRILVVDDNHDAAASLGMMLQLLGHDIRTAHDGLEAVQAAATFRPHVALLDIGLPKLNGYDVARQIRQQPWGKDLLLIAVTGWGQEEDKQRAREAGFNHHLTKPVELEAVQDLLAPALG